MNDQVMTLDDSPADAAFRAEARAWIQANAPRELYDILSRSGYSSVGLPEEELIKASKAWQMKKARDGWGALQWPRKYGGRGATVTERVIWAQEEGPYAWLSSAFLVGFGMAGPTLMVHGTEEQKHRFLPKLISGEEIWCQMFSEPAAGSDLAGVRTRAERVGDEWVVNGQKIWTSIAHFADFAILLARTDPSVPKHKGLTYFWVDMRSPGIEVRPIRQPSGGSEFNEVYLTDVRLADHQRIGEVGQGWKVALTTLMNERVSVGTSMPTGFESLFDYCCELRTERGLAIDDPAIRSRLADWAARASGLKYTGLRVLSAIAHDRPPGAENSITKLVAASMSQDIAMFALDLQGRAGVLVDADADNAAGRFQALLMRSPGTRIEGGTDEILRNIIAERVLGLPPDFRPDKDVPFNMIPASGAVS
jgi:alkylation response protein AidB-like acyl-CoA dehydrogenase